MPKISKSKIKLNESKQNSNVHLKLYKDHDLIKKKKNEMLLKRNETEINLFKTNKSKKMYKSGGLSKIGIDERLMENKDSMSYIRQ